MHVALQCSLVTLGRCMRQDRWWKRDILRCSDWTLGEQYGTDPRNVTSVDTKYFLVGRTVAPISFLSSRISNKDTFDGPRRLYSNQETSPQQNTYNKKHE